MGDTMTAENNREALSALLDGELSELEARRLLRDMSDDDAGRLARWQLARDVMQGHQAMPVPAQFNSSLMEALDQTRQGRPAWMHPVTRFAVAASVAMATVVAFCVACRVMILSGVRSSQTISTARRPQAVAMRLCPASGAGIEDAPGNVRPKPSAIDIMVEAVPMVMQVP